MLVVMIGLPGSALAAVTFSEIAWMGDTSSANYEWIEFYNDGPSVAVDGWIITDNMNLNIELAGTMPASSYVVIERNRSTGTYVTSEPFLLYSGALVNTGATLVLKRADGGIEDQIAGGDNWSNIGGDNVTKETAQYTSAGWRTGAATPGKVNVATSIPGETTTTSNENTNTNTTGSSGRVVTSSPVETVKLGSKNSDLVLVPTVLTTAYVNQLIPFTVKVSGLGETLINSLNYVWNFGDLSTSSRSSPMHNYHYPGTYVVTVTAWYKNYKETARTNITILPVTITLARTAQHRDIQIQSNAPYDLDISGYRLEGDYTIVIPEHTILAPFSTLTVQGHLLSNSNQTAVRLRDAFWQVVATWPDLTTTPARASDQATTPELSQARSQDLVVSANSSAIAAPVLTATATTTPMEIIPNYVYSALTNHNGDTPGQEATNKSWPYVALLLVLSLGVGSILVTMQKTSSINSKMDTFN